MGGRLPSERVAGFPRNARPECLGIPKRIFGLVHAADLHVKVHGFRGGVREKRAFYVLIRPAEYHINILLSIACGMLSGFSADPNYLILVNDQY